jgi:hypothetical protein
MDSSVLTLDFSVIAPDSFVLVLAFTFFPFTFQADWHCSCLSGLD